MSTLYAEPVFIGKPKKERTEKQKAAFEKAREGLKRKRDEKAKKESSNTKELGAPKDLGAQKDLGGSGAGSKPKEIPAETPEPKKETVETPPETPKKDPEDDLIPPKWFKNFVRQAREEKLTRPKRAPKPAPPAPIDVPHSRTINVPSHPYMKTITPPVPDRHYVPADYEAPVNPLFKSIFPQRK